MFGIGGQELLIIFLIVLLLFGANRIPEIARGLGRGIRDFKRATRDIEDDLDLRDDEAERKRIARRNAARVGETHSEAPAEPHPERPASKETAN